MMAIAGGRPLVVSVEKAAQIDAAIDRIGSAPYGAGAYHLPRVIDNYAPTASATPIMLSKTSSEWSKGSEATLTVYSGTLGSETAQSDTVTAYNKFITVAADKWVMLASTDDGWYLIAAECS